MKVCLLNTYDREGGAARACLRLYRGLRNVGANASMLVREMSFAEDSLHALDTPLIGRLRDFFDYLPLKLYPRRQAHNFSRAAMPSGVAPAVKRLKPDIVHLHWIPHGFVRIEEIPEISAPIVWTLHDSWPFTGGCHLPGECRRFEQECGCCPILGSDREADSSRRGWRRKRRSYPVERMTVVAPSHWMAARVQASSLLRGCSVEVIPNGVDTDLYSPGDKTAARTSLGLPQQRRILLFGANNVLKDPNKGLDLALEALGRLPVEQRKRSTLVLFGDNTPVTAAPTDLEVVNCSVVTDETRIVNLYRAADLFLMSSRQENLPNMIAEAMACGLPCAAFAVGGIPDQIDHRLTGCLAEPFNTEALANEIIWLLENGERRETLGARARIRAMADCSLDLIARRHLDLYRRVVEEARCPYVQ